jgi:hypothetical protein
LGNFAAMTVVTGAREPAKGGWRVLWWLAIGIAGVAAALITGHARYFVGGFGLIYPLQRLFLQIPGTDPSKTGWQRTRERFGSGSSDSVS